MHEFSPLFREKIPKLLRVLSTSSTARLVRPKIPSATGVVFNTMIFLKANG